jgi:hypothetical protein
MMKGANQETQRVRLGDSVDRDHPLLAALVGMLDAVESYDYERFHTWVDDIYGTVDFDPFSGATRIMRDMEAWREFYQAAIAEAAKSNLTVYVHIDRFNAELSDDRTLGWCDAHFAQHMQKPDGSTLHSWQAVGTAMFRYDHAGGRWVQHRWHASLAPEHG